MTSADLEKSLKSKLRTIAQEKNRDPADLLQVLMLERFLARLSRSSYHEHFILKGGILLSKYIDLGRETRDLDFTVKKITNNLGKIKAILEEIANIDLRDGFTFGELQISELMHNHMNYTGIEAGMTAYFGKVRSKVTIDIGFGDIVTPIRKSIALTQGSKGALFENSVELSCYPKELIFAEKLETLIYRKQLNSRMKDFHDLHSLILASELMPFENLNGILKAVFEHRQTPFSVPIEFDEEGVSQLQKLWRGYLKSARSNDKLPQHISEIIHQINQWLNKHLLSS